MTRWWSRPEVALGALVLVAYGYFYQAGGWNQNSRFDLTRAWVERGTAAIDAYHRNTGDKARKDGHHYCDKAPGVSALAVPSWLVLHAVAGRPSAPSPRLLAAGAWLAAVTTSALPTAAAVVALALLLGALGAGPAARVAVAAAYGLGTLAWPYATLLYGHAAAGGLGFVAFALLAHARRRDGGPRRRALLVAGGLLGAAVAVEYPSALTALVVGLYAASWLRPLPRLGWLALGAALPGALLALYHAVVFGGPTVLPYAFSTQPHRSMGVFMGLGRPDPTALAGILVSEYRGLLFSAPWLALAVPGAVRLVGRARAEAIAALAVVVLFVWLNASLVDWQGGWALGPRYLVPALPWLALLVGGLAVGPAPRPAVRRIGWAVGGGLAAYAVALMLIGTAVKPEVPVRIERPFAGYLLPAWRQDRVAISTQTIDRIDGPRGAPRAASNLGLALGLPGRASLLPLLAVALALALRLRVALRAAGRAAPARGAS